MKSIKRIIGSLVMLGLMGCHSHQFDAAFKEHVNEADTVLFDGDHLHPTYAYLKKGKLIGLEMIAHPECGEYTRRFYLDANEHIVKVIIEKDFYSDSCSETFDSVYVVEPKNKTIKVYTDFSNGKIIDDTRLLQTSGIDIDSCKQEIRHWTISTVNP